MSIMPTKEMRKALRSRGTANELDPVTATHRYSELGVVSEKYHEKISKYVTVGNFLILLYRPHLN